MASGFARQLQIERVANDQLASVRSNGVFYCLKEHGTRGFRQSNMVGISAQKRHISFRHKPAQAIKERMLRLNKAIFQGKRCALLRRKCCVMVPAACL